MSTGATLTNGGKLIVMTRTFNLSPRDPISTHCVGINNGTPSVASTDLDKPIPIGNGTVNYACNGTLTGSSGGSNSTNNTTIFKPGGGVTDNTAQNLLTNTSSATKTWVRTTLDANFTGSLFSGFWLYIKDSATLAKFLTSGTAVEARWRSDATNYYAKTWAASNLSVGWNWLDSVTAINALTATGTPGTLDEFAIIITTNNATDSFVAGDVVIDLIRSWASTDLVKAVTSVTLDETLLEASVRTEYTTAEAVGFSLTGSGLKNAAGTLAFEVTSGSQGKGTADEFIYIDRLRHA